jgi:transposase
VRAFAYIGGCPEMLVPDNTKTGVSEANYWDPVLNRSSQAFARHYEVAIVPARVRKPRDKATAENAVRLVEMWVLAPLRHRQLFSLGEANAALAERVEEFNNRPFAPPRQSLPSRKRGAAAARYSRRSSAASSNRCRPSRLSSANGAWPASISTTTSPSTAISIQCRTSWCNRSSTSL